MLAGIVVDTNNFTYRTRTRTFEAASTLNTMGADMVLVRKLLRDSYEEERRIASAMVNVEIFEKRFAIVAQSEDEIVPDRTTLAKISDKLLTIDGIETGFSIGDRKLSIETIPQGSGCLIIFTLFPESKVKTKNTLDDSNNSSDNKNSNVSLESLNPSIKFLLCSSIIFL
jgi:hypothetical protein